MMVIVFFSRFQRSESQFMRTERSLKEAVQMAQIFSSLPEVACTESNAVRENCIDIGKLDALHTLSHTQLLYYYDLFRYGVVTVERIYPIDEDEQNSWVIYNRERPPRRGSSRSSFFTTAIPMSLYNPETRQRYFGIMEVRYYDD